jgi:hypothetical protein
MTLKIFTASHNDKNRFPESFFDLNGDDYDIFYDEPIDDIDIYIITSLENNTKHSSIKRKINVQIEVFNNCENQNVELNRPHSENLVIVNSIDKTTNNPKFIFSDFLFNRTKAYYQDFKFGDSTIPFHYATKESYAIPVHLDAGNKNKIFVAPNLARDTPLIHNNTITRNSTPYRKQIVECLSQYTDLGYLGSKYKLLYAHGEFPECNNISDLLNKKIKSRPYGYNPPHNEYYRDTFISIYGESIEWGTTLAATEKTFDPLIKKHFILPFSATGFIKYLKEQYNFQFPNFIDYSYDEIEDDTMRFQTYKSEIKRLLSINIDTWRQYWQDNQLILDNNQNIFYNRDYHKIDLTHYL